jgi:hypothetical protein
LSEFVPFDYGDLLEHELMREIRNVLMQSGRLPERLDLAAQALHSLRAQIDVETLVRIAQQKQAERTEFYLKLIRETLPPL